jgi:hypothetical protein
MNLDTRYHTPHCGAGYSIGGQSGLRHTMAITLFVTAVKSIGLILLFLGLSVGQTCYAKTSKVRLMDEEAIVKHQQDNFGRKQVYKKKDKTILTVLFKRETNMERIERMAERKTNV